MIAKSSLMVVHLPRKKHFPNKLNAARKAHSWLAKHPKILLENVGKWIFLSTNKVLGIGLTFNEALRKSSEKPALVLKVPSSTAAYAIQHRVG